MKTSQKQILLFTEEQLTSSPEDSPVNPTQWQASDLEKKMSDTSGQRCLERFGKFSRHGLWAKTFSALLIGQEGWYSTKCRLIWKLKGTKYNRMYFQLAPSTLRTDEIGFGLLPTPTAMDSTGATANMKSSQVKEGSMHSVTLSRWAGMLPTPATRDWKGARSEEALEEAGRNHTNSLPDSFAQPGKTSQLNPPFVMEMMGFPTDWTLLPFLSGETSQSKPEEMP